ncbi:MAG TPA: kynureninase [Sphingomonadales bacterium]
MTKITRADLAALDAGDPLAHCRDRFSLPEGVIYIDGNSLGALPRTTAARLADVVTREWGHDLIRSWNTAQWITYPQRLGDRIATLIGAAPGTVVAADSTSINLYKLAAAALKLQSPRRKVVTEPGNFPTDLYILQGLARYMDIELVTVPRDRLLDAVDDATALVVLTHVHYKTGEMFPMGEVTRAVQAKGALMLWDLSHSAGAVPVDLAGANADLAVGCGYKYLNGGPGAPGFLYVAPRLQERIDPPLGGWMGHAAPFAFSDDYVPAPGIARNLCGTPVILGMAALEEGLRTFEGVDLADLRAKSLKLAEIFMQLVEEQCAGFGLAIVTPRNAERRGSQCSLAHEEGYAIMQALIARGVIGDFRAPDILRFGFTPLYVRYQDVWDAVACLKDIMESRAWDSAEYKTRAAVT